MPGMMRYNFTYLRDQTVSYVESVICVYIYIYIYMCVCIYTGINFLFLMELR